MKYFLFLLFVFTLNSCDKLTIKQPKYIQGESSVYSSINYFKDTRTNLCFAETGAGSTYAFTCVPCDSIKHFLK